MRGRPGTEPVGRIKGSPVFWLASAAIFTANALLSAADDRWVMAILQAITGMLAAAAASAVGTRVSRD